MIPAKSIWEPGISIIAEKGPAADPGHRRGIALRRGNEMSAVPVPAAPLQISACRLAD